MSPTMSPLVPRAAVPAMRPFDVLYPELARSEARALHVFNYAGVQSGTYAFRELYCDAPRCDCRRVLLQLYHVQSRQLVATINYAFEPAKPPFEDEPQIMLDPLNPQGDEAFALLELFEEMIASDRDYHDRLVRHYALWKRVVDDPSHPDHAKVRTEAHDDPSFHPAFPRQEPLRRAGPKVGANALCPCGSGKKFKRCCRT
ncbi:MAG: SEC-C domain-containing protein [Myxococcaceae bacterium]|nr:SEC-C domain-containing protein [Myxococcaceae bacterium]